MSTRVIAALLAPIVMASCAKLPSNPDYADLPAAAAPLGSVKAFPLTQVPLPPGEWVELARTARDSGRDTLGEGTQNASVSVTYARIENGQVYAYLLVATDTRSRPGQNYVLDEFCRLAAPADNKTVFLQDLDGPAANNENCLRINATLFRPPTTNGLFKSSWQAAEKYGGLPREGIGVYFSTAYYDNYLTYSLIRFPRRDGAPGGVWVAGSETPEQRAYLTSLVQWAKGFRHWVVDGAKNRLPAT